MTKVEFTKDASGYGSHRKLLWQALEATKDLKLPVLELGSGPSSTPYLYEYCKDENLEFFSYDYNAEYAKLNSCFGTKLTDWKDPEIWNRKYSVALIDESPGEHRKISLLKVNAEMVCIHDSECVGWNASNYQVRQLFNRFKYSLDDIPKEHGSAWTTLLSNGINVKSWII